jgi:hypothetical protein
MHSRIQWLLTFLSDERLFEIYDDLLVELASERLVPAHWWNEKAPQAVETCGAEEGVSSDG